MTLALKKTDGTPEYEERFLLEHQRPGGWTLATIIEPPGGKLIGEILPYRVTGQIEPKFLYTLPGNRELYDIGVNLSDGLNLRSKANVAQR